MEVKERKRESGRKLVKLNGGSQSSTGQKDILTPMYMHINLLSMGQEVRGKDLKFTRNCEKFRNFACIATVKLFSKDTPEMRTPL